MHRHTELGHVEVMRGMTHDGLGKYLKEKIKKAPGETADIEHDESDDRHQEVYVVVAGRAGFRLGEDEFEAGPGDVVAVPDPAEVRDYWAVEPGTRIVCVGAGPGAEHPFGAWIADEVASS